MRELAGESGHARRLVLVGVPAAHVGGEGADSEIEPDHPRDRLQAAADLVVLVARAAARLVRRHLAVGQAQSLVDQRDAVQRAMGGTGIETFVALQQMVQHGAGLLAAGQVHAALEVGGADRVGMQGERIGHAGDRREGRCIGGAGRGQPASHPAAVHARCLVGIADAALDQLLRAEMTARAVGQATGMDQRDPPVGIEFVQRPHLGMQAEVELGRAALQPQRRLVAVAQQAQLGGPAGDVVGIVDRRHDAQRVHAAAQEHGDQHRMVDGRRGRGCECTNAGRQRESRRGGQEGAAREHGHLVWKAGVMAQ